MPVKDKAKYNAYMREYRRKKKDILIRAPTFWEVLSLSLSHFLEYILKPFKDLYYKRR